jgi:hypothetical protein
MDTTTSALRFGRAMPTKMSVSLVDFGTVGGDQYRAPSGFTTRKSPRSDSNLPVIRSGKVLQPDAKSIRPVRRTGVICSTLMVLGDVVVFTVCLRMETQLWHAEACALGCYRLGASASCRHLEIGCLGKSPKAVEGHRTRKGPCILECGSPLPLSPPHPMRHRNSDNWRGLSREVPKSGGGPPHSKGAVFFGVRQPSAAFPPGTRAAPQFGHLGRVVSGSPRKRGRATALQRGRVFWSAAALCRFRPPGTRAAPQFGHLERVCLGKSPKAVEGHPTPKGPWFLVFGRPMPH